MQFSGIVQSHSGRGRELGFPTANLALPTDDATPAGVYAAYVWVGEQRYRGAAFVGRAEHYDDPLVQLEVHLLKFSGDLYGKIIRVELYDYIRPSKRFDNTEQLRQAIRSDINQIEQCLPE